MLHQIKNGNWVDLRYITEIHVHDGQHVVISFGVDHIRVVNCETTEKARAYRDELAALANEAQAQEVKPESWRDLPSQL